MSEGVSTSANVTSGVAMREPPLAPGKPQKKDLGEFAKEIQDAVSQAGKKKISEVLKEEVVRLGDYVTVDGKAGRVKGTAAIEHEAPGITPTQHHVTIDFEDGTSQAYDPRNIHIKVVRKNPEYNLTAQMHFDDAKVAKRLVQRGRYHDSLSKGYDWLAKHHEWEGDHETAAAHRQTSAEHAVASEKAFAYTASGAPEFINKYEMQSKARQERLAHNPPQRSGQKHPFKHFYLVPFADKDKAKRSGLMWDAAEKKWFFPSWSRDPVTTSWKFSHTITQR